MLDMATLNGHKQPIKCEEPLC